MEPYTPLTCTLQVDKALQGGRDVIMRLDASGALAVRTAGLCPTVACVYVTAESEAELARRLIRRGSETMVSGSGWRGAAPP